MVWTVTIRCYGIRLLTSYSVRMNYRRLNVWVFGYALEIIIDLKISTTGAQGRDPVHRIWRKSCVSFHPYIEAFLDNHERRYIHFVLVKHTLSSLPISCSYAYNTQLSWHVLSVRILSFSHSGGNFGGISFVPLDSITNKIYKSEMRTYYNLQTTKN